MAEKHFQDLLPHFLGVDDSQRRYAEEKYQQMRECSPHEVGFPSPPRLSIFLFATAVRSDVGCHSTVIK
jgi:hypothetical protein